MCHRRAVTQSVHVSRALCACRTTVTIPIRHYSYSPNTFKRTRRIVLVLRILHRYPSTQLGEHQLRKLQSKYAFYHPLTSVGDLHGCCTEQYLAYAHTMHESAFLDSEKLIHTFS